ncbi:glutathione s-transferase [Stylonychia lemnae]|uniref:Glutathione s-transferase n=1 Tax=Stylonychia lemnae TaxID=5949 RepID=A0A078AHT7_STYLE|nr:glutathione s-transferase [Stylonychia lemnae]|eukprot:CDW81451.1 glutathione s-transferase [Stylonychia lemnae]
MSAESTNDLTEIFVTSGDQPKPATNPNYLRLYGHHLCPFVEKARLALAARNVVYQNCEIDLSNKTEWHVAINGGFVPVLEFPDGTIIHESKVIMEYAEEAYPDQGYSTLPDDPVEKAQLRLASLIIDQVQAAYYPMYMKKFGFDDNDLKNLKEKLQKVEDLLAQRQNESGFAWGTENPTQLDIHLYPLMSRLQYMRGSAFNEHIAERIDPETNYPRIIRLVEAIRNREEFKNAVTQKIPQHSIIQKLVELPEGQRLSLSLPVKFE